MLIDSYSTLDTLDFSKLFPTSSNSIRIQPTFSMKNFKNKIPKEV
jgi:hypothetical protein